MAGQDKIADEMTITFLFLRPTSEWVADNLFRAASDWDIVFLTFKDAAMRRGRTDGLCMWHLTNKIITREMHHFLIISLSFSGTWPSTHLDRVESARPTHSHLYTPGRENTLYYVLSLIISSLTQTRSLTGTWPLKQTDVWQHTIPHTIYGELCRKADRNVHVQEWRGR